MKDDRILKRITVPTGDILIVQGEKGKLECLSLGDYGKDVNLNQNKRVDHTDLLPLSEKWVVTISSQYGCSMGCNYCDVPKVGRGLNASLDDMSMQINEAMSLHPEIKETKRLNIHFARMGEPSWNPDVLKLGRRLIGHTHLGFRVHPVVSTMMPKRNMWLEVFIREWMRLKDQVYHGEAGLQLSINSTSEIERDLMFNYNCCSLKQISEIMKGIVPVGRKITLNFAVAEWEINPQILIKYFDPKNYVVKLTPMHKTLTAQEHGIKTVGDYTEPYPYEHHADALRKAGYNVLVFIASREEDESRITCGNAILAIK